LDGEFDRAEAVLWILATSTALARSELETFETEMRAASARRGSGPIALTTPGVPMATQRGSRQWPRALAAAHSLLTAHSWGPTDLAAIAQAIVLALHELATHAVKRGALSRAGGRVALGWSLEPDGGVVTCWTETGGPAVAGPPQRRGFGTRLLERALAYDLGPDATVVLRFAPTGLHALIRFTRGAVLPETAEGHATYQGLNGT
jgi:hypothetical protein